MLSDKGIRDYIRKRSLNVKPLGQIGPASIDLHIGNQLYRSDPQAHLLYQEEVWKFAKMGPFKKFVEKLEEPSQSFDEYVSRFGIPVPDSDGYWILEPNKIYYAQTAEEIATKRGIRIQIATKSSSARNGLRVQFSEDGLDRGEAFKGKPFLVVGTYGTRIELPKNHPVCQMVVEPYRNITGKEIKKAMKSNDVTVSGNPIIGFDSVILTFHHKLLRYNGRIMNPTRDNMECFDEIDISDGHILEPRKFYLGSTKETIGISRKYVGILDESFGPICGDKNILNKLFPYCDCIPLGRPYLFSSNYVHLNAPYHWPGSDHQLTLEIFSSEPVFIKAGYPACRLLIQQLYPECESPYNSKYNGQEGPTISRVK